MEHIETSDLLDQWNNGNFTDVVNYLHLAPRSEVVKFVTNLDYNDSEMLEIKLRHREE